MQLGGRIGEIDPANSTQPLATELQADGRQPYVKSALRRLTPEAARELLLRHTDLNDPEVKQMLTCIEDLRKRNASDPEREIFPPGGIASG